MPAENYQAILVNVDDVHRRLIEKLAKSEGRKLGPMVREIIRRYFQKENGGK